MLKIPVAGRVKTRLARGIGTASATNFYRHATAGLLAKVGRRSEWSTVLAVSPDPELCSPALPRGFARIKQGHGDLGQRLQRIIDALPCGPVLVIGSDVPDITQHHIREAFRQVAGAQAVIGPAPDGGYWLVGLRRRPRRLTPFGRVRWSSPHARADTLRNLTGQQVRFLAELHDIDEPCDLARHARSLGRRIPPAAGPMARTIPSETALKPPTGPNSRPR